MTPDERLADIVAGLASVGLDALVMGGHAVRFYGLHRHTTDFDLHLSADGWADLPDRLNRSPLAAVTQVIEGPSWRSHAFRRFQIGRLADGREEWLEFWRHNHLLDEFAALHARREVGHYGGRELAFLSLPDLIRSKETERAADWQDVSVLEGFLDGRLLAAVRAGVGPSAAVGGVRSRIGYEGLLADRLLTSAAAVLPGVRHPITQAFLLPHAPASELPDATVAIEPVVVDRLRSVVPASPLHLALVEAVRRQYRMARQAADRADKERELRTTGG